MKDINQAVGNRAPNQIADVRTVQKLLNLSAHRLIPCLPIAEDGDCGPITIGMISQFQKRVLKLKRPDGRVDPGKNTIKKLNEVSHSNKPKTPSTPSKVDHLLVQVQNYLNSFFGLQERKVNKDISLSNKSKSLTESDFKTSAALLGVEVATIKAVASVESAGGGFLKSGKPKILFEGHWFSKLTKGVYDTKHPSISYKKWTKKHYLGGEKEYSRFTVAAGLDKSAAQKSTSWGKFQIMGFNHKKAGFDDVSQFVEAMKRSEGEQLKAFVAFLKSTKLDGHLKNKDWAKFAKGYNGPKYAENKYDIRLKQAYQAYSTGTK